MSPWKPRYHVHQGGRRTTANLTMTLAELLAIHLGYTPQTQAAHQACRQWLQQTLDQRNDPGLDAVSQYLQSEVIFALIDRTLYQRHAQWLLSAPDEGLPAPTPVNG